MKICLIGTSNSIIKGGYTAGIESSKNVNELKRCSVGASPSIIVPYFASQLDLATFDWLVIDTAINDRNYYIHGSITNKQIREFVEYGVSQAVSQGCKPCLLLMPSRNAFHKETVSGIMYHKISKERSIPIIDGFDFIRQFSARTGISITDCFTDDFHLKPSIAFQLGRQVAQTLSTSELVPTAPEQTARYSVVKLDAHASVTITRSTSLGARTLAQLCGQDHVRIPQTGDSAVIGIGYNAAKSFGKIVINSIPPTIKDLTTKYVATGKELLFFCCPVTTPRRYRAISNFA